jgi:tetratricopeptide (TPR) repeat protein
MNVVKLLVPAGRQYILKCPDTAAETRSMVMRLVAISDDPAENNPVKTASAQVSPNAQSSAPAPPLLAGEGSRGQEQSKSRKIPLRASLVTPAKKRSSRGGEVSADLEFVVSPRSGMGFFEPRLRGKFFSLKKEVELTAEISKPLQRLLNIPVNLFFGATFGALASGCLMPNAAPLLNMVIAAAALPALIAVSIVLVVRAIFSSRLPALVDSLSESIGISPASIKVNNESTDWTKVVFTEQTIASTLAFVITLGAANYLHQYAWNLWCNGEYQKSENLCHPVQTLATALFGWDSAVAAGCNYYIAECLRCQGKYPEAEKLYLKALETQTRRLGDKADDVIDCTYNLARVYEGEGKVKEAEEGYKRSIAGFEQLPKCGPNGRWLARVLDRQAMFYWKNNQLASAAAAEERAVKIDAAWGERYQYKDWAESLNDLGVIYYRQGKMQLTEQTFLKALARKNAVDTPISVAVTEYNLSHVYRALKDAKRAESLAAGARKTWQKFVGSGKQFSSDDLLYEEVLKKTRPDYETPNWEQRSEQLVTGPGRI